jgi:hypothetical protein
MSKIDHSNDKAQSKGLWQPPKAAEESSLNQESSIAGMMHKARSARENP